MVNKLLSHLKTPCLICYQPTNIGHLCQDCLDHWHKNSTACICCGEPDTGLNTICGHCINQPPAFTYTLTGGIYNHVSAYVVKQLKYQRKVELAKDLVTTFLDRNIITDIPQALVPMPLHWTRRLRRGFNQAELLAQLLANALQIQLLTNISKRIRRTQALEGLKKTERRKILHGAFHSRAVPFAHVAIVDDVMTTGASANALAESLLQAGAERVDLWVMTRTPKQK